MYENRIRRVIQLVQDLGSDWRAAELLEDLTLMIELRRTPVPRISTKSRFRAKHRK